jgi:hypothetical protein
MGFDFLLEVMEDPEALLDRYARLIGTITAKEYWAPGESGDRRIHWWRGRQARKELKPTFRKPGLYIWGCLDRPLYVGITRGSFDGRFKRYIWEEKSQCKLAELYEEALKVHGLDAFPAEVHQWYQKNHSGNARLRGAVVFAQEGIRDVWFYLLPHQEKEHIRALEKAVIPVAQKYNAARGYRSLLNVESVGRDHGRIT